MSAKVTKNTFFFFAQDRSKIKSVSVKKLLLLRELLGKNFNFSTAGQYTDLKSSMLNSEKPSIRIKRLINLWYLLLRHLIYCLSLKSQFGIFFLSFFFFFGLALGMWNFLGQELNPCHSSNPSHCSDNARSLTCWVLRDFQVCGNLLGLSRLTWNLTGIKHTSELGNVIVKSCFLPQFSKSLDLKL